MGRAPQRFPRSYASANAIAVDGSGNLYVTGVDGDGWGTIKYNSSGEEQWVAHYNSGTPAAIAIDKAGNVYVSGGDSDYVTIKSRFGWARGMGGSLPRTRNWVRLRPCYCP